MILKNAGFTLVELAIVMIIIGLLIGGIMKGQELIQNSRVNGTIAQLESLDIALNTFIDTYGGYPGDLTNANVRIPGCNVEAHCVSGNGNYKVGADYTSGDGLGAKFLSDSETVQYWKHLALADLISGVDGLADPANPQWGLTHPRTKLGGGLEIYYEAGGLFNGRTGQFFRFSAQGINPGERDDPGQAAVTPNVAQLMDIKIDNGDPLSGDMMVWGYGNNGCNTLLNGDPGFDSTVLSKNCVVFYKMKAQR